MTRARFTERVRQVLVAAGWHEGRDIGRRAEDLLARATAAARSEGYGLEAFPAAIAAVREFGSLTVTRGTTGIEFRGHGFRIDPSEVAAGFAAFADLERIIGAPTFPLGLDLDEYGTLALGAEGRVYLLHHTTGFYVVGETLDNALTAWIEFGELFPSIGELFDEPEWGG
jgi:hypothetical protein